jgi:membrane fusion protein, multidrug efflux system
MTESRQKWFALLASVGLTALLVGVFVGAWGSWRTSQDRWEDADLLQQQLEYVNSQNDAPPSGPEPALIRVSVAERKVVQPENPIIGRLVEVRRVTVASEVTGKILEMLVEIGSPVIGGQTVLARVDDIWPQLAVQRMQAQVASIDAHLSYLMVELQRSELLSERAATTDSELEARRSAVVESQARLAEAQAALEEESERISRSLILAPFDGTVVEKHAEVGGHLSPGAPIVDIVSRGQVDARLMVPETVINEVYLDQPLTIVIDPLGQQAQGTVVSVTPYGPAASRTFPVRVRLDDQDGRLKVGMSVTARITMGAPREALVVPSDAVLIRPDEATVWVALPSGESEPLVEPVPVTITARMRDEYAVEPETDRGRQILIEGTQVVIEGAERLTPGQPVRIIDETLSQRLLRWRHPDGAAPTRRSFS